MLRKKKWQGSTSAEGIPEVERITNLSCVSNSTQLGGEKSGLNLLGDVQQRKKLCMG